MLTPCAGSLMSPSVSSFEPLSPWHVGRVPGGPVASSPAIGEDGIVFIGSDDGRVHAVNGSSGAHVWSTLTQGRVRSSPAILPDGSAVIVGSDDGTYWGGYVVHLNASTDVTR